MTKQISCIVIPDIHGRPFWKQAVKGNEDMNIIFLGDYLDPYSEEGISREDAIENFKDILKFAEEHKDNVTLLLGNHDIGYIHKDFLCGRRDEDNYDIISSLYKEHSSLFSLTAYKRIGKRKFVFSHAGITRAWLTGNILTNILLGDLNSPSGIVDRLNSVWHREDKVKEVLLAALASVSYYRGGNQEAGSLVWADVREYSQHDNLMGAYQIFGHTQLSDGPFIKDTYADIDTRCAYVINSEGEIERL